MPSFVRQRNLQAKIGPKKGLSIVRKVCLPKSTKKSSEKHTTLFTNAPTDSQGIIFPSLEAAVEILIMSRLFAAIFTIITDCDETFNYWEPIHYLVYGDGLQTWEYSPAYALRSYASLWIFAGPGLLLRNVFSLSPTTLFFLLRCFLAVITICAEAVSYKAICREFGVHIGRMWLVFMLTSCGNFISSAAMVPSAWCSAFSSAALAFWWLGNLPPAIFFTAFSALVGWPFAALLGTPIAIDAIFRQKKIIQFLLWSVFSLIVILVPMIVVDSMYYGHLVIAPLNLVKYNVFTDHGPDLYGVESWTFYFINGFLNFNIAWVLALLCPALLLITELFVSPHARPRALFCKPYWLSLLPLYSWLLVFMLQPHKEERFLFPVYSSICLCGAIGADCIQKVVHRLMILYKDSLSIFSKKTVIQQIKDRPIHYLSRTRLIMIIIITISINFGISRTTSLIVNYSAPMDILKNLDKDNTNNLDGDQITVCYGKDWYRYPSSFNFPEGKFRIGFLKSEFSGMLPLYYTSEHNATKIVHDHFNDMNQEDTRAYTDISQCKYLVDTDFGQISELQPDYISNSREWTILDVRPFLNTERSHRILRAFYIPFMSYRNNVFGKMYLLKRKNQTKDSPKHARLIKNDSIIENASSNHENDLL